MVSGMLEFAKFKTAVKSPKDVRVEWEGSEDLMAR